MNNSTTTLGKLERRPLVVNTTDSPLLRELIHVRRLSRLAAQGIGLGMAANRKIRQAKMSFVGLAFLSRKHP